MQHHIFLGQWITTEEFASLAPRNVFHRQLDRVKLDTSEHRDRHILFRTKVELGDFSRATLYVSADDVYKLYVGGTFVAQGPTPSYHFRYNYNEIDLTPYLKKGKNTLAFHTLYQGLINRVWQSGDNRHGLIFDLVVDGKTVLSSNESVKCAYHTAYREIGTSGYDTAFLEEYDCRAAEVGFESEDFDDSTWQNATLSRVADHTLCPQASDMLVFESIAPTVLQRNGNTVFVDFGKCYVGTMSLTLVGRSGDVATLRFAQEIFEGKVRYQLRANCNYEETMILKDGVSVLDTFDYKAFRYAELLLPEGCEIVEISLLARHYPFPEKAKLRAEYRDSADLRRIWDLCVHSQKYGVQEAVYDCMEREKGFYIGDGCYTALTHMLLTGDDALVRKLINDAFAASVITDGLVTCLNCSLMQEITEYPLILVKLVLWHYRITKDLDFLRENYPKVTALLDAYRRDYEHDGLISKLDKWCVVEWPPNFRDGYDVDITEGKICHVPHVVANAYYVEAISFANKMARILNLAEYRDLTPIHRAFLDAFYVPEKRRFRDSNETEHISLIGNVYPFAFGLCPEDGSREDILDWIRERGTHDLSLFTTFPTFEGIVRMGRGEVIEELLLDDGAWLRMLREDATTTFEGWGKDTKWNTSLFHLTMSYAAVFMSDADLKSLFIDNKC